MLGISDTVCFGRHVQGKNGSPEPIEWQVLERENGRMLVISKYALDCQQYNTSQTAATWETCSLRKKLNGPFLNTAFSSEEQNRIISSTVTADKNPSYSTSPGNNTTDKVFLLSINEANKYFSSNEARRCAMTDYAKAWYVSTYATAGEGSCRWWLRSSGHDSISAAYVHYGGDVINYGNFVYSSNYAVRPALWINFEI